MGLALIVYAAIKAFFILFFAISFSILLKRLISLANTIQVFSQVF